jgi:hypothetical protein
LKYLSLARDLQSVNVYFELFVAGLSMADNNTCLYGAMYDVDARINVIAGRTVHNFGGTEVLQTDFRLGKAKNVYSLDGLRCCIAIWQHL